MGMSLKRVVFHMGSPKTGTSIIQSHLAQNRVALRDRGVLYPLTISSDRDLYRTFESHHLLVYSWADWAPFNRFQPNPFFKFAEEVAAHYRLETMLLSAENAFWLPVNIVSNKEPSEDEYWEKKRSYVRRIHADLCRYDTSIMVYLRRQDHWLESWYNQQVKNGNQLPSNMDQFAESQRYLLDYETQLKVWAEVFGADRIVVKVYEKEQLLGGLLEDFFHTLGLGNAKDFPLKKPPRHNAQLSPEALEFLNICNGLVLSRENAYALRIMTRRVTGQFDRQAVFKTQKLLSPKQRRSIVAKYASMNDRIARRYLGRENGGLFLEPITTSNDSEISVSRLDIPSLIRLMVPLMMGLCGEGGGGNRSVAGWWKWFANRTQDCCPQPLYDTYRRRADRRLWVKHMWEDI